MVTQRGNWQVKCICRVCSYCFYLHLTGVSGFNTLHPHLHFTSVKPQMLSGKSPPPPLAE